MTDFPLAVHHAGSLYHVSPEEPSRSDLRSLVEEHLEEMIAMSAPETSYALDVDQLSAPGITLYAAREAGRLVGCFALKELDSDTGELKTMRTVAAERGQGLGGMMLDSVLRISAERGYSTLYLETGSEDHFIPARAMYAGRGFTICRPFSTYEVDPHSVFMVRDLRDLQEAPQ